MKKKTHAERILSKKIKLLVIMLISLFFGILLWFIRFQIHPNNIFLWLENCGQSFNVWGEFPVPVNSHVNTKNFKMIDGNLVVLSGSFYKTFSQNGREIFKENHNLTSPIMKICGLRGAIYDVGGRNLKIMGCTKNLFEKRFKDKIISCSLSKTGDLAILTRSEKSLAQMKVFKNESDKEFFAYDFKDHFAVTVSMSENGKNAAVCAIDSSGENINSYIYVFDFNQEKSVNVINFEGDFISKIFYITDDEILVVGDKNISIFNSKNSKKREFLLENKILTCYDFDENESIFSLCLSPSIYEDKSDEILILSHKLDIISRFKTNEKIKDISCKHGKIAVLTQKDIILYNFFGKIISKIEAEISAKSLILGSNSKIFVLDSEKISKA